MEHPHPAPVTPSRELQPLLARSPGGSHALRGVRFAAAPPGRRPPIRLALAVGLLSTATWLLPVVGVVVSGVAVALGVRVTRRSRVLQGFDPGGGRLVVQLGAVSGLLAVAVSVVVVVHRDALTRFQDCSAAAVTAAQREECLHGLQRELDR